MKVYWVLLAAVCVSVAFGEPIQKVLLKDVDRTGERIIGGTPAKRYEFPYQVSLQYMGQHICGGSILTEEWILTAGHCVVGSISYMRVIAGMLNQREKHPDVQSVAVIQQIIYPSYPGGVAPYDIALLRLGTKLQWTNAVKPIDLPRQNQEFTGLGWVTGWGYLTSSNPVIPTTLQKIQLVIWSFNECAQNLIRLVGSSRPLDNTMLCLGGFYTGRETVCQGDSGGPVMQNGRLLGVASWTLSPCGTYRAPSVYTKVSKYVDWIRRYVPGV